MTAPQIDSFEDFWPYYVRAHKSPLNRAFHYVGTSCGVSCALAGIATFNPLLLAAAPVVGYGPAWAGHFFVEGNRPATFGYAFYSLLGDFKMLSLALRGKMSEEVARLSGPSEGDADAHAVQG